MWVRAADAAEIPPGTMRTCQVGERRIVVCRSEDGELHALRDTCPHRGVALSAGEMVHPVTSPGYRRYALDRSRTALRCPWHGYEFDVRDGRVDTVAGMRVRCYRVREREGVIEVDAASGPPRDGQASEEGT